VSRTWHCILTPHLSSAERFSRGHPFSFLFLPPLPPPQYDNSLSCSITSRWSRRKGVIRTFLHFNAADASDSRVFPDKISVAPFLAHPHPRCFFLASVILPSRAFFREREDYSSRLDTRNCPITSSVRRKRALCRQDT